MLIQISKSKTLNISLLIQINFM